MLVPYLVIAAALHWVLGRRFMGPIRRAMDIIFNRQTADLGTALRFSRIGEAKAYDSQARTDSHQTTIGLRMLATFGATTLLCMLAFGQSAEAMLGNGVTPFLTFAMLFLITGYYLIYIWTYRIDIAADTMTIPTYHMTRRALDPRRLIRIEDDGAYVLRLYFEDGSRAEVLKYVTGRQALTARLTAEVNRNARM